MTPVFIGLPAPVLRIFDTRIVPLAVIACLVVGCQAAPSNKAGTTAQSVEHGIGAGWAFPSGRVSATYGARGMVSTTDRIASEVGAEVIRRGGNAVDAAVATHFALAVVNPEAGNVGGGGFMIVRMADGRTAALDFREKAPLRATRDMYLGSDGKATDRSIVGHLASGVPGSVAGMWAAHQRFGSLSWSELVQPAVNLAEGLVVHERLATSLREYQSQLQKFPATARPFSSMGKHRVSVNVWFSATSRKRCGGSPPMERMASTVVVRLR